jgi:hypothetical protein
LLFCDDLHEHAFAAAAIEFAMTDRRTRNINVSEFESAAVLGIFAIF